MNMYYNYLTRNDLKAATGALMYSMIGSRPAGREI